MQNAFEIREYVDLSGRNRFKKWYESLDWPASAKVSRALARIEQGNLSNVKPVGEGTLEYRINFGPGYRIYMGRDGERLIILLAGGTKKRQDNDIKIARLCWAEYKSRRSAGG